MFEQFSASLMMKSGRSDDGSFFLPFISWWRWWSDDTLWVTLTKQLMAAFILGLFVLVWPELPQHVSGCHLPCSVEVLQLHWSFPFRHICLLIAHFWMWLWVKFLVFFVECYVFFGIHCIFFPREFSFQWFSSAQFLTLSSIVGGLFM